MRSFESGHLITRKVLPFVMLGASLLAACSSPHAKVEALPVIKVTHEKFDPKITYNSNCTDIAARVLNASQVEVSPVLEHPAGQTSKLAVLVNTRRQGASYEAHFAERGEKVVLPLPTEKGDVLHIEMDVEDFSAYPQLPTAAQLNQIPNPYYVPADLCRDISIQR